MTANSRFTRHKNKGTAGFSMVEMLVVVGIIGIMAAVGAPPMMNYLKLYKIRAAQQQVLGEIQTARNKAISKNVSFGVVLVGLSDTTYRYVIEDDLTPLPAKDTVAIDVSVRIADPIQVGPLRVLPEGVRFGTDGQCPGFVRNATSFRFNRLGTWCSPGLGTCGDVDTGVDVFQNSAQGTTICLVFPQKFLQSRVLVAPGGRARVAQ